MADPLDRSTPDTATSAGQGPDATKHGEFLLKKAKDWGWTDDGEGPLEFIMRTCYQQGLDDAFRIARDGER